MKKLEDVKILVVGDIMLDKYIVGEVERISPEAPVPIVKVIDEYATLGGCGNVVRNICELGAQVDCAASVGKDNAGHLVEAHLHSVGARSLLVSESKVTTVKERIIADQRKVQMLRIDKEDTKKINAQSIIRKLDLEPTSYDIVFISDYGKGVITSDLMTYLNTWYDTPVIIDPKPKNDYLYNHPYMITPNKSEWAQMELNDACKPEFVLVTEGKDGMTLYDYRQGRGVSKIEAEPVEVYNVSGAGDTVVAVMSVCISIGLHPLEAAVVANKCAGYVVTQTGTSTIPKNIFINNLGVYYTDK